MQQNFYKVLGVAESATSSDIKSAYRKIVLQHHPDKSSSPESHRLFLQATEAYETLSDFNSRRQYDTQLSAERRRQAEAKSRPTPPKPPSANSTSAKKASTKTSAQSPKAQTSKPQSPKTQTATVQQDVERLTKIFSRGQYADSRKLAISIINRDNRQSVPYAVLGDLARAEGKLDEAAKMYAFAAQMNPRNPVYQQLHDELVRASMAKNRPTSRPSMHSIEANETNTVTTLVVGLLILACCNFYVIAARETPLAPQIPMVSSWTLGLAVMLFLSGVASGSTLSICNFLDRFHVNTNSLGKVSSPIIALTSIAVVNFWAALILFSVISFMQKSINKNHLRFIACIAFSVVLLTLSSKFSQTTFTVSQVFTWGGNLAYIGGLCGWMVADSFKRMSPY